MKEAESKIRKNNRNLTLGPLKKRGQFIPQKIAEENSTVPLEQAMPKYLQEAEKALETDEIPSQYKERVKEYFNRIK